MNSHSNRIDSLQSLRALAFLAIFASHADFPFLRASWGVSIFFVLSGFLMYYNYKDKELDTKLKSVCKFSIRKIKKLYLLHIITTLAALFFVALALISKDPSVTLKDTIVDVILNITLTKSLIPSYAHSLSLNGVSWYLSSYFIICFFIPCLIKLCKKNNDTDKSLLDIVFIFIIEIVISFSLKNIDSVNLGFISFQDVTNRYFSYVNPFFRLLDVYAGMKLCVIYLNKKTINNNLVVTTINEFIVLAITIYSTYFFNPYSISDNPEWFKYSIMFFPISLVTIYVFARNSGYMIKILDNKFMRFLGNLSPYGFLIHHLIIRYFDFVFYEVLFININIHIRTLICFVLTVIICDMYSKIEKKVREKCLKV